mgnify:CR=1 FL=1
MADKFRPVHWSDLHQVGAPIIGWGIERKAHGENRYKPVGYNGEIHPFKSKQEAQVVCDELNAKALVTTKTVAKPKTKEAASSNWSGVTKEKLRLGNVIADKIEDGTLFQAGIYSRKELAEIIRTLIKPIQNELSKKGE